MSNVENTIIDKIQEQFPVNRVVLLITPLVILPLAIFVTAWVAQHFPGISLDQNTVQTAVGGVALTVLTGLYKWIDGHQKDQSDNKQLALNIASQPSLSAEDVKEAKANLEAPPSIDEVSADEPDGSDVSDPSAHVNDDDFLHAEDLNVTAVGSEDDPDLKG